MLFDLNYNPSVRSSSTKVDKYLQLTRYLRYVQSHLLNAFYSTFPKNARNNSAQAYDQAIKQSELPARLAAVTNPQNTTSAFGNTNPTSALPSSSSAFSNINATPSAFGQPVFGQPAFGQPAFGQPSFGQPVQNPISTTSTAPTGAFGQPLNNAAPVSAFGQPLQPPATTSVFGQPSALGQSTASSFIKPASGAFSAFNNTGSTGAFSGGGNNTTPTNTTGGGFSAFASQPSAFSLAAQNTPTAGSAFGQPSFGQPVPTTSVPTPTSVFGNPAPATSVFGAPSTFGVLSQQPQQPAQQEQQQQTASAWPSAGNNTSFTGQTTTFGAPTHAVQPETKPARTKSVYQPGSTPYDQQIPSNYKEALPKTVVQAFESQKFEWGDIPEWVPPVEVR